MSLYQKIVFPLFKKFDAETVHHQAIRMLTVQQSWPVGRLMLKMMAGCVPNQPVETMGLTFPNVLGIAAGFDKDVQVARALATLGYGHVEVGTLTPREQPGNTKPRVFRLLEDEGIINRMGFPNQGIEAVLPRLIKFSNQKRKYILGVSLGKQKPTGLANAVFDYLHVMRQAYPYSDYLALNISSPNTPGLRELQGSHYLEGLLSEMMKESHTLAEKCGVPRRPLLVKIAPDLSWAELDEILEVVERTKIDGIIATNTSISREGLRSPLKREDGGMSGKPLAEASTEIVAYIHRHTEGRLPIIGVGGINDVASAQAKLDAGATLLQVYTGFIYQGPRLACRILQGIR